MKYVVIVCPKLLKLPIISLGDMTRCQVCIAWSGLTGQEGDVRPGRAGWAGVLDWIIIFKLLGVHIQFVTWFGFRFLGNVRRVDVFNPRHHTAYENPEHGRQHVNPSSLELLLIVDQYHFIRREFVTTKRRKVEKHRCDDFEFGKRLFSDSSGEEEVERWWRRRGKLDA